MNNFMYYNYNFVQNSTAEKEKAVSLLERFEQFADVQTLEEAKELAQRIIPTKLEITRFYIGDLKCTVINKNNCFKISINSDNKYKCYDFS